MILNFDMNIARHFWVLTPNTFILKTNISLTVSYIYTINYICPHLPSLSLPGSYPGVSSILHSCTLPFFWEGDPLVLISGLCEMLTDAV